MIPEPDSRAPLPWLAALVALGLGLRLYQLGGAELWADEGYTALATSGSLPDTLGHCARDVHPPLYFGLVWLVRGLTGAGAEWVLRLPSLLGSCLGLLLGADLFRRRLGVGAALLATALLAGNPVQLFAAQEARMYGWVAGLGFALAWLLTGWWEAGDRRRAWCRLGVAWVGVHSHYLFWLAVGGGGLATWVRHRERRRPLLAGAALLLLGALPWALWVGTGEAAQAYQGQSWRSPIQAGEALKVSLGIATSWLDGRYAYSGAAPTWWAAWALLLVGALAPGPRRAGADELWALLPPLLLVAGLQPFTGELHWLARYLLPLSPWLYLLVADAVERLCARTTPLIRTTLLAGLVLQALILGLGYASGARPGFLRAVAGALPAGTERELLISFGASDALRYYLEPRGGGRALPWVVAVKQAPAPVGGRTGLERNRLGAPTRAGEDWLRARALAADGPERLWVLTTRVTVGESAWGAALVRDLARGRLVRRVSLPPDPTGLLDLLVMTRGPAQPQHAK